MTKAKVKNILTDLEKMIVKSIDIQTAATFVGPVTLAMAPDVYAKLCAESKNVQNTIDGKHWIFGTEIKVVDGYPEGYLAAESF